MYIEVTIGDWRVIPSTAVTAVRARSQIISVSAPDWQQHSSTPPSTGLHYNIPTRQPRHGIHPAAINVSPQSGRVQGYPPSHQHCTNTYRNIWNELGIKILSTQEKRLSTNHRHRILTTILHNACKNRTVQWTAPTWYLCSLREGIVEECGAGAGDSSWSWVMVPRLPTLIGPTWCDGFQLKYDGH